MTLWQSLASDLSTTSAFIAMGAALTVLTALIFWREGRARGRLDGMVVLNFVVREIREHSGDDYADVLEVTDREFIQ